MGKGKVLAMYDVRGIQEYIFRTAKVKDAIGASAIVEDIIQEALENAVNKLGISQDADLKWCTETGVMEYRTSEKKVQVLYIGGGNAYIICESRELCLQMNQLMAKYTMEQTYSLQLAAAWVYVNGNYQKDYQELLDKMARVKENMVVSKPLGALPVMRIEVKTGYPAVRWGDPYGNEGKNTAKTGDFDITENNVQALGTESLLKKKKGNKAREGIGKQIKILDSYVTKKGVDSTIAVVHIDGNNMGLRIREQINGLEDYETAVNRMRSISFAINSSYKNTFEKMKSYFNREAGKRKEYAEKETENFVLKILTAGDDITYVCNGKIALATVEYFCREISRHTMTGKTDAESIRKYGFSVCAGIALIGSHFPFHVGYDVAEECCSQAKKCAKQAKYKDGDRIGNWVDFQICKNIQARDLKEMRRREYVTSHGENLLRRPYLISTETDGIIREQCKEGGGQLLDDFKKAILYFQDDLEEGNQLPRSFAKKLRDLYPQGAMRVNQFQVFLESRGWAMPDGSDELYLKDEEGRMTAKWFDALEMMDDYIDLDQMEEGGET
ncbi:MAG: hypothetical protein Q4F41_04795 [Eubacteriales bacterium]|nr:hypothetical protein [Eubacteriales bacterium]